MSKTTQSSGLDSENWSKQQSQNPTDQSQPINLCPWSSTETAPHHHCLCFLTCCFPRFPHVPITYDQQSPPPSIVVWAPTKGGLNSQLWNACEKQQWRLMFMTSVIWSCQWKMDQSFRAETFGFYCVVTRRLNGKKKKRKEKMKENKFNVFQDNIPTKCLMFFIYI